MRRWLLFCAAAGGSSATRSRASLPSASFTCGPRMGNPHLAGSSECASGSIGTGSRHADLAGRRSDSCRAVLARPSILRCPRGRRGVARLPGRPDRSLHPHRRPPPTQRRHASNAPVLPESTSRPTSRRSSSPRPRHRRLERYFYFEHVRAHDSLFRHVANAILGQTANAEREGERARAAARTRSFLNRPMRRPG